MRTSQGAIDDITNEQEAVSARQYVSVESNEDQNYVAIGGISKLARRPIG
jgi:hypothetical protein